MTCCGSVVGKVAVGGKSMGGEAQGVIDYYYIVCGETAGTAHVCFAVNILCLLKAGITQIASQMRG